VRFLRLLKGNQESPKEEVSRVVAKVPEKTPSIQLGSPMGCPEYDRYTYHSHGQLYVQSYVEPGVLKAWCHCGAWTFITTEEIDNNTRSSCKDCHDPTPRLTSLIERIARGELVDE
jgi:hypothetical protein